MIAISDRNNLELELRRIFKKYDVDINNSINLEKDGKYLYQFDLDSQLSSDARKELEKLSDIANIIIL